MYSIIYYHLDSSVLCSYLGCFPCSQTVLGLIIILKSMLSSLKRTTHPHSLLGDFHCLPIHRVYFSLPCWSWSGDLLWPMGCDWMKCTPLSAQMLWMCYHGLAWPLVLLLSALRTACSSWGLFPQSWNEKTMWSRAERCCVGSSGARQVCKPCAASERNKSLLL